MFLTQADRDSATWQKLSRHLNERIETLRRKNDNDATPEKTASLRGQIMEAKALLALGDDKPEFNSPGAKK